MKPNRAIKHQRREAKAKRRRLRVKGRDSAANTARRQKLVDRGAATFFGEMIAPIEEQSEPRQKALDEEAAQKRKARQKRRKERVNH